VRWEAHKRSFQPHRTAPDASVLTSVVSRDASRVEPQAARREPLQVALVTVVPAFRHTFQKRSKRG
jgi:hypothetical protein